MRWPWTRKVPSAWEIFHGSPTEAETHTLICEWQQADIWDALCDVPPEGLTCSALSNSVYGSRGWSLLWLSQHGYLRGGWEYDQWGGASILYILTEAGAVKRAELEIA